MFHCHAWVLEGNSPHEAHDLTWIVHMFSILNGGPIKVANVHWLTSVWNPCEINWWNSLFPTKMQILPKLTGFKGTKCRIKPYKNHCFLILFNQTVEFHLLKIIKNPTNNARSFHHFEAWINLHSINIMVTSIITLQNWLHPKL